ncbi:rhomboid-related protein 4-like [Bolinopsis microptera]|uniref:rhomboid-related protein 4-like n=1 Tax=Bolinopsis microptera TaxID=2820187 RepID=UPI00307AB71D
MFRGFNRMLRGRGNRGGRQNLGVMLLAFQIFQFGIDRIPIITLVTLITNIGVYLRLPELFDIPLPKVHDICISYQGVVVYREYHRLVLSGFYHLSDMHLYFNMASFLYKGTQLEPRLGTGRFAAVIGSLLVGSSSVYCAIQFLAAQLLGPAHIHSCAAGFSCVLFGLKVIMQSTSPPSHRLFGIPIHMAYWSELVWISLISPNVSFVGHLAGIITGLLMTKGPLNFVLSGETPSFFEGGVRNQQTWGSGVSSGGSGGRSGGSGGRSTRQDNTASYNNEAHEAEERRREAEEAELQEVIRRSLEEENNPSRRPAPRSEPTGYTPGRLYPDLPASPSAPPPEDFYQDEGFQGEQGNQGAHDPSQAPRLPGYFDEIRRRRVQRFQ